MKIKSKGFGLIGLLITLAIIALLVVGFVWHGQSQKNEIQAGNDAIKQAQDAANKETQYNQGLQNQVQDPTPVNTNVYHNIENSARNLPK